MNPQLPNTQNDQTVPLVTMIVLMFVAGGIIYFAGYFWFLNLQKKSRTKGQEEAEAEALKDEQAP